MQLRAIVRLHRAAVICLRRRIVRGDRFSGIITVICTITIIAISIVGIGTHGAGIITVLSVTGCIITGFDSLLGYYIWGAINAPTKLEIGNMILTRYNNTLKVQVGNSVSYLDLYRYQTVSYLAGYTSIEVTTGNGSALVRFYDDYGNEATYRL